jgi:hypothetical protein
MGCCCYRCCILDYFENSCCFELLFEMKLSMVNTKVIL